MIFIFEKTFYDIKIAFKKRIQPLYYKYFYNYFGKNSVIDAPLLVRNRKNISIEKNVIIKKGSRIELIKKYCNSTYTPELIIGENTTIEFHFHVSCANKIIIENDVLIAGNVTIVDNHHEYFDIHLPVHQQPLSIGKEIIIGKESFIGMGSRIMPGVKIGKHCVIGANSVVTSDIPDYCIAVGVPAKIIKKYNFQNAMWEKYNID